LEKKEILEKLTQISPKEEKERKEFLSKISEEKHFIEKVKEKEKKGKKEIVFRPIAQAPPFFEKFLIRILGLSFVIFIIFLVYFIFHYFSKTKI